MLLDLTVVIAYLALAVWGGRRFARGRTTLREYYLTDRRLPWWAVMGSIVATETSTVTVVSVPGFAFGGNLTFLQLALGYLVGRVFVAVVLLPAYFSRELLSAYQLLAERVGRAFGQCAAVVFLLTRNVADGLRLFATALVLAAMLATAADAIGLAGLSQATVVIVAILIIAAVTLAYTWLGGMAAVVWMDVVQLGVYLTGAFLAIAILLAGLPEGGWEAVSSAHAAGKLVIFDFAWDLARDYTFWSGVLGGAVFIASTHGTDQMFVQRYLCTRSLAEARLALITSGVLVFFQFAVFLGIGVLLWSFYAAGESPALVPITVDGTVQHDRVFPLFLMTQLPPGLRGLLLAAVVAAAMSTLSSSLNSSAASTVGDFYLAGRGRSEKDALRVSRWATVAWAMVQVGVAVAAIGVSQRVIDDVLAVQFFSGGLMLGVFLLSVLVARPTPGVGIFGLAVGLVTIAAVSLLTDLSWHWYVLVGSAATVGAGCSADRVRRMAGFGNSE